MHRTTCIALAACFAGVAAAQSPARPDPADPKADVPVRAYESAFKGYRPYYDPDLVRWRVANEEMGRLNGHMGHVPGSVPPRVPAGAAQPPAHSTPGERK
jgi:hypothetical protein